MYDAEINEETKRPIGFKTTRYNRRVSRMESAAFRTNKSRKKNRVMEELEDEAE